MPKLKKKLTGNFTIINNTVLRDKRIDQFRSPHESSVEKCSDDGQMDGYMQEKEIYTEVVKSNIFTEKNVYFTIDYLCRLWYDIIKYKFA